MCDFKTGSKGPVFLFWLTVESLFITLVSGNC